MLKHVRVIVPLLVLLFSLLLTVFVVYTAYSLQLRHNRTLLENLADRQTMALQQFVDGDIHFIGSAANFSAQAQAMTARFTLSQKRLLKVHKA